jgi:putative membrane protein insertion efficiency factor
VPALRFRFLRRPRAWLLAAALVLLLAAADLSRPPARQLGARIYIASVGAYRRWLHPLTGHWIRCRFRPTCSQYSIEATEKYGLPRGLVLSARRLARCRPGVPFGTADPLP